MSHTSCTRRLHFCAGHRLMNHAGKCQHIHGHNYVVYITAESCQDLDDVGRVVDFSVIKEIYDPWIQENWDHGFIANKEDSEVLGFLRSLTISQKPQKIYEFNGNPTAENLAIFLSTHKYFVDQLAKYQVKVKKIVVWETENCFAEYSKDWKHG